MVGSRNRGRRYARAERARLLEKARAHRAEGWSWARIGEALGLSGEQLRRWSAHAPRNCTPPPQGPKVGAVVPVTIVPTPELREAPVTLVAPSGWRIEGISVNAAVDLLRRLA